MKAKEFMKTIVYPALKDESDKEILHCVMEQYANQRVIDELKKWKKMMEGVRDKTINHSINDLIVGLGRTIDKLKQ